MGQTGMWEFATILNVFFFLFLVFVFENVCMCGRVFCRCVENHQNSTLSISLPLSNLIYYCVLKNEQCYLFFKNLFQ